MTRTKIEWCGEVWNPVVGCEKVSRGCNHCYAERMAKRLAAMGRIEYQQVVTEINANGRWTGHILCLPERLDIPMHWKKPRRVFVDSMSDLFHPDIPKLFIYYVLQQIAKAHWHTFVLLTKRPDIMQDVMGRVDYITPEDLKHLKYPGISYNPNSNATNVRPIPNLWLGVSVEDQKTADERIPFLLQSPAAVRFVSVEPMLGRIDLLQSVLNPVSWRDTTRAITPDAIKEIGLHWVICGSESGPSARPFDIDWARDLRDQCTIANVPFFLKQMPVNGKLVKMPALDGQVWNQYPGGE